MDFCPVCHSNADSMKSEQRGLHVVCGNCGDYLITGECLDYIEYTAKGNFVEKTQRWLRETRYMGLRMITADAGYMEDRDIREFVTLQDLKNMYLRTGTREEYDNVLRKCLALQKKLGRDCVTIDEAQDIFPTVDEKESKAMARKMVAAGDLGNREENGVDCIFVTPEGQQRLKSTH